jgi:hypothetical protein
VGESFLDAISLCVTLICAFLQLYSLSDNSIGDVGATMLGETLSHNNTLTELLSVFGITLFLHALSLRCTLRCPNQQLLPLYSLCFNNISTEGAAAIGLALKHNTTVTKLK